jgi:orotate phosphoribosyltransferase-like protein
MIGCLFKAELEDKLTTLEKQHVLDQIKKTKGVFSAQFAKVARKRTDNAISVHAGMPSIADEVKKIHGVKSIKHDTRGLM